MPFNAKSIIGRDKQEKDDLRLLKMLMLYCEEGSLKEVVRLLEARLNDATQPPFDIDNQNGSDVGLTLLSIAIKHHHIDIAEYLIAKGANVNAINKV
jgi:ankyrin repeat protein